MFQTYDVRRTDQSNYENAGVWEEYRYDALGRRVLVRTRTDGGLCEVDLWTCTGRRTTGASPGHTPRPLTIETGL